jgi:hypothetical protein
VSKPTRDVDQPILLQPNQPIERNRGCWNCISWENQEKARAYWSQKRQADLGQAVIKANSSPQGENDPAVVGLRRMVDQVDHAIARGVFGICLKGGSNTDFVHNAYLCENWTAREGASLATSGTLADKLPEELMADNESKS